MIRHALGLVASAALISAATAATAACPGYGVSVTQVTGSSYNPVDTMDTPVVLQLTANGAPLDAECVDTPVLIEGAIGDPQPLLFTGAGGVRLVANLTPGPDASQAMTALVLSADARSRLIQGQPVNVQVGEFRPGQFLRAGSYLATIRVSAGATELTVALATTVEPALLFQLSSADGVEEIFLNGDPQTGVSGSTVFFYRTNTALRVSATSLNGGALIHERGESVGRIPYNASLDGSPLNLAAGVSDVDFSFVHTNLQARTISVNVPAAGPLIAGRYEDVITFSFAPY